MLYMNTYDVEEAQRRLGHLPNLGAAVETLANLVAWTNRNSDGWAYWPVPCRSARKLMELIEAVDRFDPQDVPAAQVRAAYSPIKAFRTKANQGGRWGIRVPNTCNFDIVMPTDDVIDDLTKLRKGLA